MKMLPIHSCGPDVVTLALLSICWACPHRPADIDIPPRPSEFLTARIGLLLGSHVDIDVVHDWMIFVQRCVCQSRHGDTVLLPRMFSWSFLVGDWVFRTPAVSGFA
jgi:hypothetical protein